MLVSSTGLQISSFYVIVSWETKQVSEWKIKNVWRLCSIYRNHCFSHQYANFFSLVFLSLLKFRMSNSPSWDFAHLVDHVPSRYMAPKFKAFSVLLTRVHCSIILESFRSKNKNEDEYKFVCLVIVRMHHCPWHVMQAGKAVFTRTRVIKESFELETHQNIIKMSFSSSVLSNTA